MRSLQNLWTRKKERYSSKDNEDEEIPYSNWPSKVCNSSIWIIGSTTKVPENLGWENEITQHPLCTMGILYSSSSRKCNTVTTKWALRSQYSQVAHWVMQHLGSDVDSFQWMVSRNWKERSFYSFNANIFQRAMNSDWFFFQWRW